MEHLMVFDKVTGKGVDIDVLSDGRVVTQSLTERDMPAGGIDNGRY
jgi:hypothetical protein